MKHQLLLIVAMISTLTVSFSRCAEEKKDDGFVPIFDGKTLDGWDGDPKFWSVKDGAITGATTKETQPAHNTFLFWKNEVGDFELHCKCKEVGGNSGIQFRSKRLPDYVAAGYQADLGPGKNHNGKIYDEHGKRGFLASVGEKSVINAEGKKQVISTDEEAAKYANSLDLSQWIDYTIIAKGNHLQTLINGKPIADCTDNDTAHAATSGVLAFQLHKEKSDMTVQFKDIEIKKLD
jgi:hypothetical protein